MKTFKSIIAVAIIAVSGWILQSCNKSEPNYIYPNALVTVKNANGICYFQLDDNTTLLPTNITKIPYNGKEVRALVNCAVTDVPHEGFSEAVIVNVMDSILTKHTVPSVDAETDEKYGNDAVDILKDWVTVVEDGYLTMRFATTWGTPRVAHGVNLLTGVNPENPYEVEFRHNANGDVFGNYYGSALVAFNLKDLPDTKGEKVKLTVRWKSFQGEKTVQFDYCTRKSSGNEDGLLDGYDFDRKLVE